MANIVWTPPPGWVEETGAHVCFSAPCGCTDISGLQIGENVYTLYTCGWQPVPSLTNAFQAGSIVEAVLNCENKDAFILSALGGWAVVGHTHDATEIKQSLGYMSALWTGSWSSGTISVPNTDKYTLFQIRLDEQGTCVLAMRYGTHIRGIGGYSTDTPTLLTYQFAATVSDNTWTLVASNYARHETDTTAPCHSYVDTTVVGIYGII